MDADDPGECHTWRAWRSRVRKKEIDDIMEPWDLPSTTWYLNRTWLRTWDHFPVVVKIDGKEFRVTKGRKDGLTVKDSSSRTSD